MTRIFALAELAGHVERPPLPRGWAGTPSPDKRFPIIYPAEDRRFLGTTTVPLWVRLLFGYLHREGSRLGESIGLQRRDVDLAHGTVNLDENKTDHPRFWKLSPGVAQALAAWFEQRGGVVGAAPVFVDDNDVSIDPENHRAQLRPAPALPAGGERARGARPGGRRSPRSRHPRAVADPRHRGGPQEALPARESDTGLAPSVGR